MNQYKEAFEKMRPYSDKEVNAAINRITGKNEFVAMIRFLFPDIDLADYKEKLSKLTRVKEFQGEFSYHAVKSIIDKTTDGFEVRNLDYLSKDKAHLFIANHRDIVLDSAFLQAVLYENNLPTSQITFGSNLMSSDFVIDLGKLNKMFTFYRDKSRLALVKNAYLHSAYIKDTIVNKNESVWIAQRDGRTKDGHDLTQSSVLKMLLGLRNFDKESIRELNIVPLSISYEKEPCLAQKIREKHLSASGKYIKTKTEDFESVLSGIISQKGRVNLSFGKPVNLVLDEISKDSSEDQLLKNLNQFIDKEIYQNYALWPLNYIAFDRLNNSQSFADKYTRQDIDTFEEYMNKTLSIFTENKEDAKQLFYENLAAPVQNSLAK